ncbi:tetratricopeptide repeat-containing sulfotransferase family protein [Dyella sp. C9]|uniref:tetratricopeptide repeat-containing sulfotransferase family protein n=1 Tax=Dyella sp. C9 TaxID=2202154 RepID=UPI000DEED07B|nr:tetratricopeptide repeat-containing sulfotransferase family protein [Dyella sp. C9]
MSASDFSRITTAIQAGQPVYAEELCRQALLEYPRDENLLLLLAVSLQMQQRLPDALPIYAELTRLYPASSLHWNNYGGALVSTGKPEQAHAALVEAIRCDPANAMPKFQLGLLLIDQQDYLGARSLLLDACMLDKQSPRIRVGAARACCLCQDAEGAKELLKPWRTWMPLNDDAFQLDLAQVLTLRNDVPDAGEVLEDLVARQPGHHDACLLLAAIYERLNRLDDAGRLVAPLLRADSGANDSQRNEADHLLATLALRRNDFAAAASLLERSGPQDDDDAAHYFQLGALYDKQGDTAAAMRALHEAHRLDARQRHLDSPEFFSPESPAMPVEAPSISAEQYARWPRMIAPDAHDSPIFVVGFPRSGTTLLEQMLDAHPGLQSMDENPFFNNLGHLLRQHDPRILQDLSVLRQYDCDELRKRYHRLVSERISRRPGTRLIDKNPLNMQWLPMIHRLFPEAKFILALRHPCDVILSCYMQCFRSSGLAAACGTLERLAHAYVETMERWLSQEAILKPTVMLSRYEELVTDFPQQVARIATFLELDDASPMLSFDQHARNKGYIGTPSYSQVIEPVNRKGLGRWQKYRADIDPILPIIEPIMRHWGYSVPAGD